MQNKIENTGFTMAEVTIALIIVAVMVTVVIPKLTFVIEKMRAQEGGQLLYSLLTAQKRYAIDHDDLDALTSDYADNLAALDVDVSATSNFNQPEIRATDPLAKVARNNGSYTLYISGNATTTCNGTDCPKLGYSLESSPW